METRVQLINSELQWLISHFGHSLFPWVSSHPYNEYHKVSSIDLYQACQSDRTSWSPTTIWSNTTSLTSLLQKTWWQWKFLCFNTDQRREFIEPLRSSFFPMSTSFAPWSSRGPIDSPVDLLPFMYKKAFLSGLQSFCAVSWIPLVSDWFLIYTWPVTLWHLPCSHLNNLFPTFPPDFCFLLYEMDAKVFIWAPNL